MMRQTESILAPRLRLALPLLVLLTPAIAVSAPARNVSVPEATAKPTAPIAIAFDFEGRPEVGQPLDLTVSVSVEQAMTGGTLSVTADDPVAVIDPVDTVPLGDIGVGESVDVGVTVLPLVVRTHYMNVTVSGTIEGLIQTRSINVPIRVTGGEGLRKAENDVAGKTTERVRSFEAIETVR